MRCRASWPEPLCCVIAHTLVPLQTPAPLAPCLSTPQSLPTQWTPTYPSRHSSKTASSRKPCLPAPPLHNGWPFASVSVLSHHALNHSHLTVSFPRAGALPTSRAFPTSVHHRPPPMGLCMSWKVRDEPQLPSRGQCWPSERFWRTSVPPFTLCCPDPSRDTSPVSQGGPTFSTKGWGGCLLG